MRCCPDCFGDRGLRRSIFPSLTSERGTCSYCGSGNVLLVDPVKLVDVVGSLINIYEQSDDGVSLVDLLKTDWGLFDHPNMDAHRVRSLLSDVLDDGDRVRSTFVPSRAFESNNLLQWERFRAELMYGNRFFPREEIDQERLASLLSNLLVDAAEVPALGHRARLMVGSNPFLAEDMGAPPKERASHGRANPAGIPYLYVASDRETAVAEVRPHTGERVCLAEFSVPNTVKLVDLRRPRKSVSPFLLGDEEKIGAMRGDIGFLERLGEELTRPVVPSAAPIDYVPSQFLCEFIKKSGYDGVVYRSSVGVGMNLALFAPLTATIGAVTTRSVIRVSVDISDA